MHHLLDMRVGTPGSAGRLIPGVACRIHKADGTWGGVGEKGQLVVTSPKYGDQLLGQRGDDEGDVHGRLGLHGHHRN